MGVNFLKLQPQIRSLGETARKRKSELDLKLISCHDLLREHDSDLVSLQQRVEEAASKNAGLRCAVPVHENLLLHHPASRPAPVCTILSADGSQINPDAHGSVFFGLVNVGVFRIRPGSGESPGVKVFSDLLYDETLYSNGRMMSEDLIALHRDVEERRILAELAKNEEAPLLTLTDGPLELYHEPRQDQQFKELFQAYLSALDELALMNVIIAGYVDRPRADLVVRLLELLIPMEQSKNDLQDRPLGGITDLSLFREILKPGERSAIFRILSRSASAFEGRKALHFFYLNVGTEHLPALARVEIPLWVIEDPTALDTLQSVLVEQSHQAGSHPYPYPLIRAHEIAVVKMEDRQQLTNMIETELVQRGFPPGLSSNKQFNKQNLG
ncbi:MAG: DNA double-strand break repair nuclease NurA [Chloroflexi bacterium]|nr:DNA double-strand break repair nuclease NurA [Chloroflexota bacterium]